MPRLPPASVRWTTIRITCLVWVILRVLAGASSQSPHLLPPASLFLMLGAAATAVADVSASRERVFLANLGVSRWSIAALGFLVAGLLEVGVAVLLKVLGVEG